MVHRLRDDPALASAGAQRRRDSLTQEGFEIEGPSDESLRDQFLEVCSSSHTTASEDGMLLAIPQTDGVDTTDRIRVGADFLKNSWPQGSSRAGNH